MIFTAQYSSIQFNAAQFQQRISADGLSRGSQQRLKQICPPICVILWPASEASTAEISWKLPVIFWAASEASTAEISWKLLDIAQRFFNAPLMITRFPFYVRRGFRIVLRMCTHMQSFEIKVPRFCVVLGRWYLVVGIW